MTPCLRKKGVMTAAGALAPAYEQPFAYGAQGGIRARRPRLAGGGEAEGRSKDCEPRDSQPCHALAREILQRRG